MASLYKTREYFRSFRQFSQLESHPIFEIELPQNLGQLLYCEQKTERLSPERNQVGQDFSPWHQAAEHQENQYYTRHWFLLDNLALLKSVHANFS